ncbi:hypothetical protein TRFO_30475 [Tritrichomonas foetus]|uniref:Integral membrane protein n=1 Tax=Tritrichomonas foetus TaxID=1144522 RepID=A0A1J4JY27_9EUKA|nr:hypothetical protein TRFO_30475 [Tritrichomonas foetus]|eukprot:OHT02414.1 hypothetical protein TRFO_30475 [Tritrichomonas foetus]
MKWEFLIIELINGRIVFKVKHQIEFIFMIKMKSQKNPIAPYIYGTGFLLLGILLAITEKSIYQFEAYGSPEYGIHKFHKPWFYTSAIFVGMSLAIVVYVLLSIINSKQFPPIISIVKPSQYLEFIIPGFFDLIQTFMSNITIIFVGVSVDYMMRGGTILGVALILNFKFKQEFKKHEWIGMGIVALSMCLVGLSSIINAGKSSTVLLSRKWTTAIIILKAISQIAYAVKLAYEQYFSQNCGYSPVLVVGLEGSWSLFFICGVVFPVISALPGPEGNGIHEDMYDTVSMLKSNKIIMIILMGAVFGYCLYNICSVMLIQYTSAAVRTMVESFRTLLIWLLELILFYAMKSNPSFENMKDIGEEWNTGSWIQLTGFICMTFGLLQFGGYPKSLVDIFEKKSGYQKISLAEPKNSHSKYEELPVYVELFG